MRRGPPEKPRRPRRRKRRRNRKTRPRRRPPPRSGDNGTEEVPMLRTLMVAVLAAGLAASPASADKGGKGKGKSKGKDGDAAVVVKDKDQGKDDARREVVVFADRDREAVRG